jgi:hypothetical protein
VISITAGFQQTSGESGNGDYQLCSSVYWISQIKTIEMNK